MYRWTFEEIKQFIDGFVEQIVLIKNFVALVNEDGKDLRLEHNRNLTINGIGSFDIVGKFVIAKLDESGDNWEDLSESEMDQIINWFK